MPSFLDYYADEVRKRQASANPQSPAQKPGVSLSSLKAAPTEDEGIFSPSNPIGWTLDMLSRPLYGVTNANRENVDRQAQGTKRMLEGDLLGGLGEVISGIPTTPSILGPGAPVSPALDLFKQISGNNTNQKFIEGVINPSNNPDLKLSNSDLLEYASDKYNTELNPGYEDVQDNVNPWVKGVLGLVGDIGLDPLTYVPGAAIAKVGTAVKSGVKGLGGIKDALTGAKALKGAGEAEDAVKAVAATERAVPEAAVDNPFEGAPNVAPQRASEAVVETAAEAPQPKLEVPTFLQNVVKPQSVEKVVEGMATEAKLSDILKTSPKTPEIRKEIQGLFESLTKSDVPTPPSVEFPTPKEWARTTDESVVFNIGGIDKTVPVSQVRQIFLNEVDAAKKAGRPLSPRGEAAQRAYLGGYEAAKAVHDQTASQAVLQGIEAYQNRLQTGGNALRNILGEELTDLLLSKKTEGSARRTLLRLETLFSGKLRDPEQFLEANPGLRDAITPTFKPELDASKSLPNTPESIDEAVAQVTELSPVSKALSAVFREENLPGTPEFTAKYGKITRTNPVAKSPEDRTADWWRHTNTFTQYGLYKKLQNYISDRIQTVTGVPRNELYGPQRAAANRRAIEDLGSEVTDTMETFGTPLHIGVKDDLVRLTFPQVYEIIGKKMDEIFGNPDVTNLALHNYGTAVAFTRLMNVAQQAVVDPALTTDDFSRLIRATGKDSLGANAADKLPNNITATGSTKGGGAGRAYRYPGNSQKQAKIISDAVGGYMKRETNGVWVLMNKGGNLPEMLARAISEARPALISLANDNAAAWAARGISEAQQLAGQELRSLRRLATDEGKAAARETALAVARRKSELAKQAAAIAATPEGTQAAVLATDAALGDDTVKAAEILSRQENRINDGVSLEEAGSQAMTERYDAAELGNWREMLNTPAMEPSLTKVVPTDTIEQAVAKFDLGEQANAKVQEAVSGFLDFVGHHFNRNFGIEKNKDLLLKASNAAGRFVADAVVKPVKALSRTFDQPTLAQGLRAVQQGTRLDPRLPVGQAAMGIEKIISKLFDLDSTTQSAMGNIFLESGAKLDQINQALKWAFGGNTNIQLYRDAAESVAKTALSEGGAKFTKAELKKRTDFELREQWRNWDLGDDVADALVRLGQAASRVAEHQAVVASFLSEGKKAGWVVQTAKGEKPPAGFVKIVDSSGTSSFGGLLPKNTYVHKDVAPELARMDYLTTASRQLSGEVGNWVRGTLVPITNTWKQGMTIYRPGHHVRNAIGNWTLQYVARGGRFMNESSKAALKLMGMRNDFEGFDAIAALRSMGDETIPRSGDVLFTTDRFGDFTDGELWSILNREGMLPTYAASEGLLSGEVREGSLVSRILKPLDADNNPVGRLGAAASQNIDHGQRIHHLIQILMQEGSKRGGKWKSLSKEQVIKKAAEEIRKLHPDSSMLTASENKYLKLVIPFYTWMRGVLPGALESALQHPGRIMQFPKISYNLAVASGINPDSISDPFPEDQLFPSFLHESAFGPQFKIGDHYIRINPGVAHFDLAESLAADPVRGVAGMVNPVFRAPAELLSGGSWSTGGRINDQSDYIDQNIPFVNFLSNISGTSLTGSVPSLFGGEGLDPQNQVARGNKTELDQALALWNLLTGTQTQNLSRPNYINYAEIEKRNAEGQK